MRKHRPAKILTATSAYRGSRRWYTEGRAGCSPSTGMALWCNWLTRRPLKAESPGSSPGNATKFNNSQIP